MFDTFSRIKDKITGTSSDDYPDEFGEDYLEIDSEGAMARKEGSAKVTVKPFVITEFTDVKAPLDALREGSTIALVNIRPIKDRDLIELKRVVNKLKKTCDAIDGDIAGFGEDWIVVTPAFAQVARQQSSVHETYE